MEEGEYIQELQERSRGSECSPATLTLTENAVAAFPKSARLWCLRGNVICRCLEDCNYSIEDAVRCYQKATELDPFYAHAHEKLAHYSNEFMEDPAAARRHYKVAAWIRRHERP